MSDPAPAGKPAEPEFIDPSDTAAIDELLKQAQAESAAATPAAPVTPAPASVAAPIAPPTEASAADLSAIDELLKQASFDDPNLAAAASAPAIDATAFDLPNFQQAIADAQHSSIDLLRDVDLNVKIELGRSQMLVEEVLKLAEGSVVELDKLAGDPVDVFVNDRLVARGEVLVLNDNFCVRVNEIISAARDQAE